MIFKIIFHPTLKKNHITRAFHNHRVAKHVPEAKILAHSKVHRQQNNRIIQPHPGQILNDCKNKPSSYKLQVPLCNKLWIPALVLRKTHSARKPANRAKPVMKAADNVPGECPLCPVEPLPNNQSENGNNGLSFDLYPFVLCFYLSSRSNRAQNRRKRLWNRSAEPFFSFPSYKVVSGNFINLNYCVT